MDMCDFSLLPPLSTSYLKFLQSEFCVFWGSLFTVRVANREFRIEVRMDILRAMQVRYSVWNLSAAGKTESKLIYKFKLNRPLNFSSSNSGIHYSLARTGHLKLHESTKKWNGGPKLDSCSGWNVFESSLMRVKDVSEWHLLKHGPPSAVITLVPVGLRSCADRA